MEVAHPVPRARSGRYWKYGHSPVGLSRLLQEREVRGNARVIDAACQGHGSLVRRLQCEAVLDGHGGCVNTLQWNETGKLLASGSDDHNVIIWNYEQHKKQQVIESGHTLNIFAVCFVPGTDDHVLASGAMDNDVRIHYAPFREDSSKLFRVHRDRVKDIGTSGVERDVVFNKDNKSEPQIQPLAWLNGAHMDEPNLPLDLHLEGVQMLHEQGREALDRDEYTRALKSLNLACGARGVTELTATRRKELHHDCAKAYLGRSWNADSYLAALQCKKALELDPNDRDVELTYIKALNAGKRQRQAKWQARRYKEKYPDHEADVTSFLNGTASTDRVGRTVDRTFRLYRSSDEDDSSDSEDEVPHGNQDDNSGEDLPDDDDGFWEGNLVNSTPVNCDVLRRYIGYCNVQTDIKEAAFLGKNDAYIIAGSDDGRALVWDKSTGELVNAIEADADIVNCVQPHPFDACLATSGIENVIRLWGPTSGEENTPTEAELEEIVSKNQSQMDDIAISFEGAMHNMVRLVFQAGGDHQAIQECATS
ncbi:Acyltransferase family [Phytophthora nicotianae]|uniref:Acyltransferase family n=1 Tax=Phytophthora nicotianae TaxID=4792 RepID=A0A0W8DD38_PHYNI|nr:Acyltransferase family [Phytophthora nicotianae]